MTGKAILDTDILSEYLKGHDAAVAGDYFAAATIKAKAGKQGSVVELPDCLIASIGVGLDWPLVTGNTGDFMAIQRTGINLAIENWR